MGIALYRKYKLYSAKGKFKAELDGKTDDTQKEWWTRLRPIRTTAEIQAKIIIEPEIQIPVYQKLAVKVKQLRLLGMSFIAIGKSLGIDSKTAIKAWHYLRC